MKTLKGFSGIQEGILPVTDKDPLIYLYTDPKGRRMTGHMNLSTAANIHRFDVKAARKALKTGGDKVGKIVLADPAMSKSGYNKRKDIGQDEKDWKNVYYIEWSKHNA